MRATLDKLISAIGLLVTVVLLGGSFGLFYASSFIGEQVDQQLSDQKITMPEKEAFGEMSEEDVKALEPYAGSQLDTGPEAKAYADHFILTHMNEATGGETYATLGPKATEACGENHENADSEECIAVNGQRDTAFKGSTLRGLLLYGYAFATMGSIAFVGAWVVLLAGLLMLALAVLGFLHGKKADTSVR